MFRKFSCNILPVVFYPGGKADKTMKYLDQGCRFFVIDDNAYWLPLQ